MGWLEKGRRAPAREGGSGARGRAAGGGLPQAGPTHHEPERLAAELRALAGNPRCTVHADALRRLSDAVRTGDEDELRLWAGGGLVAAYCGPDALTVPPEAESRRARRLRRLSALPSVLVFVPLLVTWAGLGAATHAYQRMRGTGEETSGRAGPSGSFLTLWQQGFDGHLWPFLRFDMMVVYTVVALLALMAGTLLSRLRGRAEESERHLYVQRLSGALAQVEALAARAAHSSPARFAEELRGAAAGLRTLLTRAADVQESAHALLSRATTAAGQHLDAVKALESAAAEVRSGTADIRRSVHTAARVAGDVAAGAERLTGELAKSGAAMADSVDRAGRLTADRIGAAGQTTAERMDKAALDARKQDAEAAKRAAEWMRGAARDVAAALDAARASHAESAQLLNATLSGLDRAVAQLPEALEGAAAEGAERIGAAYDLAIAALAAALREEVDTLGTELAARLAELRDADATRDDGRIREHTRLLQAVERLHEVLRPVAGTAPAADTGRSQAGPEGPGDTRAARIPAEEKR
ncbi:hypothetical protein [Streptomyces fungicidicus]|uniref:hypothetical protein n=1 Tax=Streptomyces fungicidicus TaxID=68203 RepID=UPI0037F54ACD